MGSGISFYKSKHTPPWKSNSKGTNKHNQLDSTGCLPVRYEPLGEEDTIDDSRNIRKQNLHSDMDATDGVCNYNKVKDSKTTTALEDDTKNHEGEVRYQLNDTADKMDNHHDKKATVQTGICENMSQTENTFDTVNTGKGKTYEESSAEINDTSTDSKQNEMNLNDSSGVKAGEGGVLKYGQICEQDVKTGDVTVSPIGEQDVKTRGGAGSQFGEQDVKTRDGAGSQICEQLDDSTSNQEVEPIKPKITAGNGSGAAAGETYKTETLEHSPDNKENKSSNIEQTKSDDEQIVSPTDEKNSYSELEQSLPPNSNGNTDTSTDGATGKPTDEKDKHGTAASDKTDNYKQTSTCNRVEENLQFYRNELYSKPFPGAKIEDMLEWKGDYIKLERTHSYIQWLFPIPESRGMNYSAQPLQDYEALAISEDETLRTRVLEAFKMMLDFYGMELDEQDQETVTIKRGDNWKERFEHLNRSMHNHFRITRIIKALGELGWKHLQMPWLEFIMHEAITNRVLPKLSDESTLCHFIDALKEDEDKGKMYHLLADLNESSHKIAAEVDKNGGKKGVANSSDKIGEGREDNCDTDNNGKGSVEDTEESSENNGKEEKPNVEKDNIHSIISKEDINDNTSKEDDKRSDENNARDLVNEINENENVVGDSNASKEIANNQATLEEKNESGESNENHSGAENDEAVANDRTNKQEGTETNKAAPECKFKDGEGNTTQDDTDQNNQVAQGEDEYDNDKRDTENTEKTNKNVDKGSIDGTMSKVITAV